MKTIKRVKINRTGKTVLIPIDSDSKNRSHDGIEIARQNGYKRVDVLDIEKYQEINWSRAEYNRLVEKDGILYRFNNWIGFYPFTGVELEEIGTIKDVPIIDVKPLDPRMDAIDDACSNLIAAALKALNVVLPDEYADADDFGYATGSIPELREKVLEIVKSLGYSFVFKDENA